MAEFTAIEFRNTEPGIGLLRFNRPARLNAMSLELVEEVHACLAALEAPDRPERVLILTGAGRGFCAGTDLKSSEERHSGSHRAGVAESTQLQRRIADLVAHLRRIPQPVIAAVNGVAAGGGFSLSMAADVRIAAESAQFIASFANIGLSACEMGSSYFLPRLIGLSRAAEILYTGRAVGAKEAGEIGFVSRVVPDGRALEAALEVAKTMLGKSPFGLKMTKEVINQNIDAQGLEAALYLENRTQTLATRTEDFVEAVRAFGEKRPPKFSAS